MSEEDWIALRTAALARPRSFPDVGGGGPDGQSDLPPPTLAVLRVTAAGGRYAIDLRWLRGVRTLKRLARLPLAPPHVAGLVAHDGAALPVFYLSAVLGAPLAALPERGQALVLGRDGDLVAVAVDEVGETRELRAEEIFDVPAGVSERLRSVLLGATEDGLLLLDSAMLLAGSGMTVDVPLRGQAARPTGPSRGRAHVSDDPLSSLRAIFWDEVEDALETLDREGLTAAPPTPFDGATARARFEEAYRLMHSLKGASRAVGFADIEALCHAAEERLGAMAREASALGVAPPFETDVARVTEALREALAASRAASPVAAAAIARTTTEMENAPPARLQAPAETSGEETIRVPLTRLGRLLRAGDRLVEQLAGHQEDARAFDELDQGLLDAIVDLSKARRALGGTDAEARLEALRRIEAATSAIRTLTGWSVERRAAEGRWRASLDGSGSAIVSETRALRMVPLASLGAALERAVEEAARSLGKRVTFRFEPREIDLDRKVRDGLREPLLHAVRNCVDHGLESEDERVARGKTAAGTVTLRARVAGSELSLRVEDDGRGVDEEALATLATARGIDLTDLARRDRLGLLLRPGWSTRRDVSAFSGRGVGLDVVRQRVAALRGRVELESTPHQGTSLLLQVPLDLSATRLVVFSLGDARLALVTSSIERLVRITTAELAVIGGQLYLPRALAGDLVPLADLPATLGLPARSFAETERAYPCLIVVAGDRRIALRVDALTDERDAIVSPLHPRLRSVPFVLATTMLAEGEIALVLDAEELALSAVRAAAGEVGAQQLSPRARRILLVDDSVTTLQLERTLLENAGFEVKTASDGEQALQHLESDETFDALVSDIEMPRLDGLSLAARVRRRPGTRDLPIVLVTGLAQDEQRQRALDIGVNAYIVKGRFDEDELVGILEQLT